MQSVSLQFSNIIILMKNYQKYSLSSILNTYQLSPHIYDTIIHEIKSPLQQQSIELTNDNSILCVKVPKRPNIPPPPQSPFRQFNQNFSRTHQSYQLQIQKSPPNTNEVLQDYVLESVVSPLDYQICRKQKQQSYIPFCGGFCKSGVKSEHEIEISVAERGQTIKRQRNLKRIPIFKEFISIKDSAQPKVSVQSAVLALKQQNQQELALFLSFLSDLEIELKIIDKQRKELHQNIEAIYRKLSLQTQYTPQVSIITDNHSRILRRLKSRNTGEALAKILRKEANQNGLQAAQKLQTLFTSLCKIEETIFHCLKQQKTLQSFSTAYAYLTHNFGSQRTFVKQLQRLFESLNIWIFVDGLSLLWKDCEDRKLTYQQFMEGVSLNDFILRSPNQFESDLVSKGFQRNN